MKWRIKNNMARYIRTHTHICVHTHVTTKNRKQDLWGKAKEGYSSTWRRSDKRTKKKKKNAPKEYRVLSLSTEDAQGKMDTISSILNLSAIDMQF